MDELKILTRAVGTPHSTSIDVYISMGGYNSLKRAVEMGPDFTLAEVKKSNLRGRGGAGFPAGVKWGFLPKGKDVIKYMVCNADESEPGTFKDRLLIENDPHMILEGLIISGFAVSAKACFLYIRGEFPKGAKILAKAISESYSKGFLGKNILGTGWDYDIHLIRGAGAYICGEETALMNSAEGKRGEPRLKPPFPAGFGVYGAPSNINNVETFACVPHIIERGADWFLSIGPQNSPGPKLYCLSGHLKRRGVYELPMGISLKELIYEWGGGISGDKDLKAVIPGGSSTPVLKASQIEVNMDFESLKSAGSMLGSAGVIVMNSSTCMVKALLNLAEFYARESCGQCTPCREGTHWMMQILRRMEAGIGRQEDPDLLLDICDNISFKTICPLGDAAIGPVNSFVRQFRNEFDEHIRMGHCIAG